MDVCLKHQFLYAVALPIFLSFSLLLYPLCVSPTLLNSFLASQTVVRDPFSVLLLHYPEIAPLFGEPSRSTPSLTSTHFLKPGTMLYLALYPPCLTQGLVQTGNSVNIS